MKYVSLLLLAALAFNANVNAQTTVDSVVIDNPNKVVVTHSDNSLSVSVKGKKDDPTYVLERNLTVVDTLETVTTTSVHEPSGLCFGIGSPSLDFGTPEARTSSRFELGICPGIEMGASFLMGTPDQMNHSFFSSYELRANLLTWKFVPRKGDWWVTMDWGLSYSRFSMKDHRFVGDTDYNLGFGNFPQDADKCKSGFTMFNGDATLLYHRSFGKYSSWAAGLMYSGHYSPFDNHCFTKYVDAQGKEVSDMQRIDPRRNSFSLRLEYSPYKDAKFYLNFSPWSPFKKGQGPQYSTLSVGLGIGF